MTRLTLDELLESSTGSWNVACRAARFGVRAGKKWDDFTKAQKGTMRLHDFDAVGEELTPRGIVFTRDKESWRLMEWDTQVTITTISGNLNCCDLTCTEGLDNLEWRLGIDTILEEYENMAIDWNKLQASDFVIKKPEWPPSRPSAEVEMNGALLELMVARRLTVTDSMVNIFVAALQNWGSAASEIAARTQRYLQKFLPGRIILPSELLLWGVSLYLDDSHDHNPISVRYMFKVGGDYSNESYNTIEFNDESTIEMHVKIRHGEIDMSMLSFDVINDF